MNASQTLVQVKALKKYFPITRGIIFQREIGTIKAVDDVSFEIKKGETLGLVGESGCGKTTTGRTLIQLYRPTAGEVLFDGINLVQTKGKELRALRKHMQMIFQDPFASMDPRWRVRNIIAEPLKAFKLAKGRAAFQQQVAELLVQVGLSPRDGGKYPHEFSGGQRQRISIARALSINPEFLVCDEPTSALDVSVQAQILNLMKELQRRLGLTYLFISHNLAVIYHISDQVGVMYLGRLCEVAGKRTLFSRPQHPYTRLLLDTVPDLDITGHRRQPVAGEVPDPIKPPPGCAFHPRCPVASEPCSIEVPRLRPSKGALVACHTIEADRR
ncbi:MAG: ATP-binding cassette domain-containing protein [Anaerolineales bacterium]|nr:ATP-binding cassette domain-containing protein [Anaerolineales bacterium]